MQQLTDQQISFLTKKVRSTGLTYQPLEEDLVDHLACLIENDLQNGISFKTAFEKSWKTMQPNEIKALEKDTLILLTNKSKIMNNVWNNFAFGLFAIFSSIFYFMLMPSTSQPEFAEQNIQRIENDAKVQAVLVNKIEPPSRVPLNNQPKVTSNFGMRFHPILKKEKLHKGIDFKAAMGTPVYATGDGVVEKVVTKYGYGKMIVIKHDNTYQSLYAQLSKFEVKVGDNVKKGDIIGATGNSGLSTAPHLHYEVLRKGKAVDPEQYF